MRRLIVLSLIISLLIFQHLTSGYADSRRIEASSRQSDRRIALVIGNADYKVKPLQNPLNDANSMSEALEKAGFEVMPYKNLNRKQMRTAIREFGDKLAATGGMGLFYYAGHGMEVGGKNYLIPVEADIQRITELEDEAVSADLILRTMEDAKNKLNLLVLDACRDNPFGSRVRSGSQGLAGMNPPTGVLVMYAAGKGKTADDGSAGNGVFTRNFIDNMFRDGLDIRIMLGKVAEGVIRDSNGQQSPHMEGMIIGEFSFRPATITAAQQAQAATSHAGAVELQYWQSAEKSSTASAYRAYLKKYPNGEFAELAKEKLQAIEGVSAAAVAASRADQERISREQAEAQRRAQAAEERAATERRSAEERSRAEAAERVRVEAASHPTPVAPVVASSSRGFSDPTTGMEFVKVPGGCFQMGDTFGDGGEDEKPVHEVCVSDFSMGKYEVTQGQWKKVMGSNPSNFSSCGDNCPVERVSWELTQEFIKKLNHQGNTEYRLPTEAEWEYAARSGGKKEKFAGGDDIDEVGWYVKNSNGKTHPVGQKKPNGMGLFDMSGNVWEWCNDWYGKKFYEESPKLNPRGPVANSDRILRGGSWDEEPDFLRTSGRFESLPKSHNKRIGFRLVAPAQ